MTFESHQQVISEGSKTKCGKIQIDINDEFLIGKSIAFLSQLSVGRKIKSLYEDKEYDDLSYCLSKHENNNEYIYRCFIKKQTSNNKFEIDWRYQCNTLYPFILPKIVAIEGYNFYQNFIYNRFEEDHIENRVIISDDIIEDEKSVQKNLH